MKKIILLISLLQLFVWPLFAQNARDVLVTIGDERISVEDFKKIYQRNNRNIFDPTEKKSPQEYLELYVNFKLKVIEAKAMGLDTVAAFKEELAGYRAELAAPYLTDVSFTEQLVEDTYQRMLKEVNASHILISVPNDSPPGDTLAAYQKVMEIKAQIAKGLDFNEAAVKYSQDPSAMQNRGDLGWFSAFQMVTPFEDAAFTTPVGKVSGPVRTNFGYHLLKVNDLRDAQGEIRVAHIMKMFAPDITDENKMVLRAQMDSIYQLLLGGADFALLAGENSDDQRSAVNGGELPYFGRSRMIPEFSDPAFALKQNGDITPVIETDFGYHIIKRLDLRTLPSFEEIRRDLEERISRDPARSTQSRELFISKLKKEYGFERNQQIIDRLTNKMLNWFAQGVLQIPEDISDDELLFALDGKNFTAQMWFNYLREVAVNSTDNPLNVINNQYMQWEEQSIIGYENSKLEAKYPEFRSLMQEYHDGLLLFAISEDKIWKRASTDTIGLTEFYATNKHKYKWGERFQGAIITFPDAQLKEQVEDMLEQGVLISELPDLPEIDENNLIIIEGAWSKGDNHIVDYYVWGGAEPDGWQPDVQLLTGKLIGPEPKKLEEARGFHISDYQQYLEKIWLKELQRKYPVKVNKKALKRIENV